MMPAESQGGKLLGIQAGRGIAACTVVFYHSGRLLGLPQYAGPNSIESLFHFGNSGVDFFFVLSGFIIFYIHSRDIGRPDRFWHYAGRRVTRVFPLYWLLTAAVIVQLALKKDWADLSAQHVISSIFLLPNSQDPILSVGWTLVFEMTFYCAFGLAILSRSLGAVIAVLWAGAAIALSSMSHFLLSPFNLEFGFGVLSAAVVTKVKWDFSWLACTVCGLLAFAAGAVLVDLGTVSFTGTAARMIFGPASALIIIGIARGENGGAFKVPGPIAFLGSASYSIYLVHVLVIAAAARMVFAIPAAHAYTAISILTVAIGAIIIGCLVYAWIEAPLQKWVRGFSAGRPQRPDLEFRERLISRPGIEAFGNKAVHDLLISGSGIKPRSIGDTKQRPHAQGADRESH
jgi:peptidoglycan/LPS O-acetylase OafA/YrhL